MTNKKQPEALRLAEMLTANEWPGHVTLVSYARECVAELRRLHAENEALRAAHVQNPAEIEHVAGDVSKNSTEKNVTVYAELPQSVGEHRYGGGLYTDAQMRAFADATRALRAQQPTQAVPPADIAQLRHLCQNMLNGGVRDTASAKRIAEGLLAPVIERMERAVPPAGREPLPFTPRQRERLYYNRPANVGKGLALADWHRVVEFIEAAHDIKGGQHGTDA